MARYHAAESAMRAANQRSGSGAARGRNEPRDSRVLLALLTYLLYYPLWPWHVAFGETAVYHIAVPWAAVTAAVFVVVFAANPRAIAALPRSALLAAVALVFVHLLSALVSPGAMVVSAVAATNLVYLVFAMLLFALPWRTAALLRLHRGLALGATLLALISVVRTARGASAFIGPVSNPNTVAAMLIIGLAMTTLGLWRPHAFVRGLLIAVQVAGLASTSSRAGMGAVAMVSLVVATAVLLRRRRLGRRTRWSLAALAVAGAGTVLGLAVLRLQHEQRFEIWRGAANMIADRPWLGVGPGQFEARYAPYRTAGYNRFPNIADVIDDPHSFWVAIAAEAGIVGLLSWLVLFAVVLRHATGSPSASRRAPFVAWLALLIQNSGDQNLTLMVGQTWLFYLLGLVLARSDAGPPSVKQSGLWRPHVALAAVPVAAILALSVWRPLAAGVIVFRVSYPGAPPEEVLRKLARVHALQPHLAEPMWNYGFVAIKLERVEQAIAAYEEVRRVSPDYAHVNFNLGLLHAERGDLREARRFLERELVIFPAHGAARGALAEVVAKAK